MKEILIQLNQLIKLREELNKGHQTVDKELESTLLDLEISILKSDQRKLLASRALIFLDAWRKTGRFTAIRRDGVRRDSNQVITGDRLQDFWNVRSEALMLANWSLWINSPSIS